MCEKLDSLCSLTECTKLVNFVSEFIWLNCGKTLYLPFRFVRDPRANYEQSLKVLKHVKEIDPAKVTKTSLMLGLGETDAEVKKVMQGNRCAEILLKWEHTYTRCKMYMCNLPK